MGWGRRIPLNGTMVPRVLRRAKNTVEVSWAYQTGQEKVPHTSRMTACEKWKIFMVLFILFIIVFMEIFMDYGTEGFKESDP